MKIKTISRNEADFTRQRATDAHKVYRNADPSLHPFEKAREYTRALTATKMERMFAKPFIGAMDGHSDGVHAMSTISKQLRFLASGACDGELRLWDLSRRSTVWHSRAHTGFVNGVCSSPSGELLISCGSDKTVKVWDVAAALDPAQSSAAALSFGKNETDEHIIMRRDNVDDDDDDDDEDEDQLWNDSKINTTRPIVTLLGSSGFTGVSHRYQAEHFATSSAKVDLWDYSRAEPVHSFEWGADTVDTVRFNAVESHVLASTASDRSIVLYDVRNRTPIRKLVMRMRSNDLCWNPMEAFNFTVANEDHNLYTFDMRKLDSAQVVHKDHVYAVMCVDYSPTGRTFVSGSYDRTVRIFNHTDGHSKEVYHSKRMQRVWSVRYSLDDKYIMSGSDEFNIRLWKSVASRTLKTVGSRERAKLNYRDKLKRRFRFAPDIQRISKTRIVPAAVRSAKQLKHIMAQSKRRKQQNIRAHSKPGSSKTVAERRKKIVKELE
jgi:DDB1- and CUL4-associated factor 13